MKKSLIFAFGVTSLFACSKDTSSSLPNGSRLSVSVAPLDLPSITDATYSVKVKNGSGQVVWDEPLISSTGYGNGKGDFTYIGSCDASGGFHTVELVLLSLSAGGTVLSSPSDYVNPTILPDSTVVPMVLDKVVCQENGDTPVTFNLTIMRSANQGFFDIGVNFDDIFCSAKLDCKAQLLHNEGKRDATVVMGFACTAGQNQPTYLYLSDITLECKDLNNTVTSTTLNVAGAEPGQQGPAGAAIFQWAAYRDQEFTTSNFEKCFWNHAIGLNLANLTGKKCKIIATGTATDSPLPLQNGIFTLPTTGSYPYIRWEGPVLEADGKLCTNMALNESNGAVSTNYVLNGTPTGALPNLSAVMRCGEPSTVQCLTGQGDIAVEPTGTGFSLSLEGTTTASFNLPSGYTIGPTCCTPGCCQ
jgi:hypothetical protein